MLSLVAHPALAKKKKKDSVVRHLELIQTNRQLGGFNYSTNLMEHPMKLISGLQDPVSIIAIDNIDEPVGVLEVMSPQGPNLDTGKKFR